MRANLTPAKTPVSAAVGAGNSALWLEARACHERGDLRQARLRYEEMLKRQPKHFEALNWLGIIAAQSGELKKALVLFDKAMAVERREAGPLNNKGLALQALQRWDAALASFDAALALKPDYAEAWFNRGNLLRERGRYVDALASYDQALAHKPDHADALCNRGVVLKDLDCLAAALASFDQALAIDSRLARAHYNKAQASLLRGDLAVGWAEYEWRWRLPDGAAGAAERAKLKDARDSARPLWLGRQSIDGKTILLMSEQGYGDTLQFCRYASLVAGLGARVIMAVQPPLAALVASVDGVAEVAADTALPEFDVQCPLMSLPLAFRTTLDTVPRTIPYLRSASVKRARWRARLGDLTKRRVGLAWSGSMTHSNDRDRSISLADLLAHLPAGARYVSLQKDIREHDRRVLRAHPEIFHWSAEFADFGDSAALCDCLDLVITVDTSVAHLSGALGKETWIMLPFYPDWRWLQLREDSPWYPTAKLYRQAAPGDWDGVLDRIRTDLNRLVETTKR